MEPFSDLARPQHRIDELSALGLKASSGQIARPCPEREEEKKEREEGREEEGEGREERRRGERGEEGKGSFLLLQLLPTTDNSHSWFKVGWWPLKHGFPGSPDPAGIPLHRQDPSWRKPRALRIWMAVGTHLSLYLCFVTCGLTSFSSSGGRKPFKLKHLGSVVPAELSPECVFDLAPAVLF